LSSNDRYALVQQTHRAPSWMQPILSQIAHSG
jgi:hypothetical protein